MTTGISKYTFLILAVCFFTAAAIIENGLIKKNPEIAIIDEFQEQILKNQESLHEQMDQVLESISEKAGLNLNQMPVNLLPLKNKFGIGYLVYEDDQLIYWSNRSIAFYQEIGQYDQLNGLVKLPNGYYVASTSKKSRWTVVGLLLVRQEYDYENKYLQNRYFEGYDLPASFQLVDEEVQVQGLVPIRDEVGNILFSIAPLGELKCNTKQLYLPGLLFLIGLILFLLYLRYEFKASKRALILKLMGLATVLFLVYWVHLLFRIPYVFYHLTFLSSEYFAFSSWLPSLGDFFILTVFFFFWILNFGKSINITELSEGIGDRRKIVAGLLLLFGGSIFLLVHYFIEQLILNSTVSFSLNTIIEITGQSAFAIFSVGLMLFSAIYFIIMLNEELRNDLKFAHLLIMATGVAVFLAGCQYLATGKIAVVALAFFIAIVIFSKLLHKTRLQKYSLGNLIIFVSLTSIYSLIVFNSSIIQKEREVQKLFAITLDAERDLVAEAFLMDIQREIDQDPAIINLLARNEDYFDYIEKAYFNSYFRKYLLSINVCGDIDSLYYEPYARLVPCNELMNRIILEQGDQIPGTQFYFMDNMNGRISYTGRLQFVLPPGKDTLSMYIDLDSDLLFEGIGFPELLIEKSKMRSEKYKKFDYAKYYGGELTDRFGDYNYNRHIDRYLESQSIVGQGDGEFIFKRWQGREHLIYHTQEHNYVIVSREVLTIIDYLISFPYLFVFYFLSITVMLLIGSRSVRKRRLVVDMKFRIQAAIISIVFISLMGVALATILYNVEEYKQKHQNDLNEKMKSIAEEIDMRLEDKEEINEELIIWLHRELAKLSNIFRTDINIYGADGTLIASSRGEVFENGLISTRMNARAYDQIVSNFQGEYMEFEDIGSLSYLSAYKPIINNYNSYLGFINLPYFIKQDNYSQEISTFVVAFINLFVLLLLAGIIAAVFIANQITRPLVVIQENLRKIELGKHNDPIHYTKDDEIGSLVKEYNKKVNELAVSADLLARSERETAWREMAKQIAHEIKNPLTPMKLNIQYLQRTKGEDETQNKHLERVTNTLIEQIDNLSNIATEFSNFAKIPTARNQIFNLSEQLQKVIDLYETHDRAQIDFHTNGFQEIEVNADREQLSRAIINLIRNGIQSIPDDKTGRILIWLMRKEDSAIISVKDNGSGIPVELRDKLFSPSFTTKSSGMGLGLAIVKNIVENFAGKIWFETELEQGTTFFMEIPIWEKPEFKED